MQYKIKQFIRKIPIIRVIVPKLYKIVCDLLLYITTNKKINTICSNNVYIYYIGIAAHPNLGDLAQSVCIRKWLRRHYPNKRIIEIETNALVNTHFSLLNKLKSKFKTSDTIVFQSGYTTTDLGGYADEMHRAVMKILPDARMLMMPQTIYFKDVNNKMRTSVAYNAAKHLLFLARDKVSYDMAKEMFPNLPVKLFPDIVTTLIGKYQFSYKRDGIVFCCRDDSERFYSEEQINDLITRCEVFCHVYKTDTTKQERCRSIIKNAEEYINNEIDRYAHYKLVVTDRFHGTIFALAANTPVIVIKTTDHKVIAGAEWFINIYGKYINVASSLEEAFILAKSLYNESFNYMLPPYFEKEYYDKLPKFFEQQ